MVPPPTRARWSIPLVLLILTCLAAAQVAAWAAALTVRASVDTEGGDPDDTSLFPSISAKGQYVAFESLASDLVPGDGNGARDVFVRDLVNGTTLRASVDTEGGVPDGESSAPSISPNGRYVAFHSFASDLVPHDRNRATDVFVRNPLRVTASVPTEVAA